MEIIHITANADNVVDHRETRRHLESAFGIRVVTLTDHLRGTGHAEDIAFPGPLVQTLARISSAHNPDLAPIIDLAAYREQRLQQVS